MLLVACSLTVAVSGFRGVVVPTASRDAFHHRRTTKRSSWLLSLPNSIHHRRGVIDGPLDDKTIETRLAAFSSNDGDGDGDDDDNDFDFNAAFQKRKNTIASSPPSPSPKPKPSDKFAPPPASPDGGESKKSAASLPLQAGFLLLVLAIIYSQFSIAVAPFFGSSKSDDDEPVVVNPVKRADRPKSTRVDFGELLNDP